MQKRCDTAGISNAELDQGENPELGCQNVIALRYYFSPFGKKIVELLHKVRVDAYECLVEHLVELEYIIVYRFQLLDLIGNGLGIALTDIFQYTHTIFSECADIV